MALPLRMYCDLPVYDNAIKLRVKTADARALIIKPSVGFGRGQITKGWLEKQITSFGKIRLAFFNMLKQEKSVTSCKNNCRLATPVCSLDR